MRNKEAINFPCYSRITHHESKPRVLSPGQEERRNENPGNVPAVSSLKLEAGVGVAPTEVELMKLT